MHLIECTSERVRARDGSTFSVRSIQPSDRDALHAAFHKLSPKSRYRRFLAQVEDLDEPELSRLTEVDHTDHEALVAMTAEDELVGVARFIRLPERADTAEVAVTVADRWQRRGVGTALLVRLASRAVHVGVDRFVATCFADNLDMLAMFHDLAAANYKHSGSTAGVVEVELELPRDGDNTHVESALRAGAGAFSGVRHPRPPAKRDDL